MTRVMIVDDQEMIRVGLRTILDTQEGIDVVAEAENGARALALLDATSVDVVLMDIRMPGLDGVEATRQIRTTRTGDQVKIIILTTFDQDETVLAALRAGANGFLSKGVGPRELADGIREVASGGGALSAAAAAALIGHVTSEPSPEIDKALAQSFAALTVREREIVMAVASGRTNEEIAAEMFVSPFTVRAHTTRAMNKVGAATRAQLVAYAYRAGIVA